MTLTDFAPAALLYVPASNARALEKARGLAADMLILDLEDAVPPDAKDAARAAMRAAVAAGFPGKRVAVRVNGADSPHHPADIAELAGVAVDAIVVPKVDAPSDLDAVAALGRPVLAMIETPRAIFDARHIAADARVAGLIAGLNDLAHALRLPPGGGTGTGAMDGRAAMMLAIQTIVLAARAADKLCFDGVYNAIDDAAGFAAEAAQARALGFDGKTLIHPGQIAPCIAAFTPDAGEIAAARALIDAARGGAQRHNGAMIEDMHVAAAHALLTRANRTG